MADVGAFIANMEKAGAKVDALAGKVEKSAKDNSKAWGDVSTGLLGVGAAATVGLGAVASGYANFDAAMSQVSASTGASVEDMERLRKAAMDAGAEFGQFSSTDAAGALEELGKAGLDTTQSIAALSGLKGLAAADGMQVARAA